MTEGPGDTKEGLGVPVTDSPRPTNEVCPKLNGLAVVVTMLLTENGPLPSCSCCCWKLGPGVGLGVGVAKSGGVTKVVAGVLKNIPCWASPSSLIFGLSDN